MKLSTFATVCFVSTFIPIMLAGVGCDTAPTTAEAEPAQKLLTVEWWNGYLTESFKTERVTYGENRIWFTATDGRDYVLSGPTIVWGGGSK